jgi:hypothetical protein
MGQHAKTPGAGKVRGFVAFAKGGFKRRLSRLPGARITGEDDENGLNLASKFRRQGGNIG